MTKSYIVITTCTNRKRTSAGRSISLVRKAHSSIDDLANGWKKRLSTATNTFAVRDLYAGRSFTEALLVRDSLNAELYVISAGLGLVHEMKHAPSYNLTIADSKSVLAKAISALNSDHADWWKQLNGQKNAIARLVNSNSSAVVLLAAPASYLPLIYRDLEAIPVQAARRLRIFTSSAGVGLLPANVTHVAMPYDERIEGSPYSGTRTDFAQRAMRHFVDVLKAQDLSIEDGIKAVTKWLSNFKVPSAPDRAKATDEEVQKLIRQNWKRFGGSSTQLLRYLRDEALVSCEQSRFRALHGLVSNAIRNP
jgi:hypothetical protein